MLRMNKIPQAVTNILESLSDIGYLSDIDKRWYVYRVQSGDLSVYEEVRELLLKMAADLKKL